MKTLGHAGLIHSSGIYKIVLKLKQKYPDSLVCPREYEKIIPPSPCSHFLPG